MLDDLLIQELRSRLEAEKTNGVSLTQLAIERFDILDEIATRKLQSRFEQLVSSFESLLRTVSEAHDG